jgi:hypothetical protein
MIRSFRCPDTERLAQGWAVPRFQSFERVARCKLRQPEIAGCLDDLRVPPQATGWKPCEAIAQVSTASGSTTSSACASSGRPATPEDQGLSSFSQAVRHYAAEL